MLVFILLRVSKLKKLVLVLYEIYTLIFSLRDRLILEMFLDNRSSQFWH